MGNIDEATLEKLRGCSTATVSTLLFKRGIRNAFLFGVRRMSAASSSMVGPAFTLRNIPCREDLDTVEVFRDLEHPQRKAIETCPPAHVLVIDCRGDTHAASGGGILLTRLAARGCAGVVSDGCFRDSGEIAELALPVYGAGPSAPLNLTRHHAIDINVPIGCGGVPVYPGDYVLGDADGVIVIPLHLVQEIAEAGFEQERFERFVMEEVQAGKSILGLYPPNAESQSRYAEWRAKNCP